MDVVLPLDNIAQVLVTLIRALGALALWRVGAAVSQAYGRHGLRTLHLCLSALYAWSLLQDGSLSPQALTLDTQGLHLAHKRLTLPAQSLALRP